MIGIPYETRKDIEDTIEFIREISPDSVNLCTFTPYPGTELYNYVIEKNLLDISGGFKVYDYIGHHSTNNFFLENITKEDYQRLLDKLLRLTTEISERLTFRKMLLKIRNLTKEQIKNKLLHPLSSIKVG
ncbi:MAG: hypothetical protein DRP84_07110 [Spirochaetes bacterium]|nr:MAG: hypothetical protein DRP84_07110 [Spirochaetota bacterium]